MRTACSKDKLEFTGFFFQALIIGRFLVELAPKRSLSNLPSSFLTHTLS